MIVSHAAVVDVNQKVFAEMGRRHDVSIVTPAHWRHEYSRDLFPPMRLASFEGSLVGRAVVRAGSVPLHAYVGRLRPLLRDVNPDMCYVEEEPYSLAAFQWVRAAAITRTPAAFYSAQNIAKRYPAPFEAGRRYVYSRAAAAIAVTDEVRDVLRATGFRRSVATVPLAVDTAVFTPEGSKGVRAGRTDEAFMVGFLGRLVPEKGIDVLLTALGRLRAQGVRLLCIGSGPMAARCRSTDGVTVAEGVAHRDVPRHLRTIDVLALPSRTTPRWKEQFGRAMIEAMACGIPVIGSDSGHIPRVLGPAGCGVIVPEGDAVALAGAVQTLMQDAALREQMGRRGRETAVRSYSLAAVALNLETALTDVVRAHRRAS